MQVLFYDNKKVTIHDNKVITTFNKDTQEHEYFFYKDNDFYLDAFAMLDSHAFKEKYYEKFRNITFDYLSEPTVVLNVYDRESYMDNKFLLVSGNDRLDKQLIDSAVWRYTSADIILIRKLIRFGD